MAWGCPPSTTLQEGYVASGPPQSDQKSAWQGLFHLGDQKHDADALMNCGHASVLHGKLDLVHSTDCRPQVRLTPGHGFRIGNPDQLKSN